MSHYKAMVVHPGPSGLPEDVYVNTFHFAGVDPGPPTHEDIAFNIGILLDEFYRQTTPEGVNLTIWNQMPADIGKPIYKVYDMSDPVPREPVLVQTTAGLPGPGGLANTALPSEVALVSSFYADRNLPRQRGRVYLGPFIQTVNVAGRPSAAFIAHVAASTKRMVVQGPDLVIPAILSVYSTVDNVLRPVTAGWVDNEFDTQRRRGEAATSRTLWFDVP